LQECRCAPPAEQITLQFVSKASGRNVMTDMAVWDNTLFYGTNDHGVCEDAGEVYTYPCKIRDRMCFPIGDFDYFEQQGMGYVRYGNNNIIVPGKDPTAEDNGIWDIFGDIFSGSSGNRYKLFVYDGQWHKHEIKPDAGGHLLDAAYFNGNYYVLTNYKNVVVKDPNDYSGNGDHLRFEPKVRSVLSLTVWNNNLYLTGPKSSAEYYMWKYDGQEEVVKDYYTISYHLDLAISKPFKGELYVKGESGGLYKTESIGRLGFEIPHPIFVPIDFFKDFIPSQTESRQISDIAVLNDKIYVSVMVGQVGSGSFWCNDKHKTLPSVVITGYEIYSSEDGENWEKVFYKPVLVKNYPNMHFPIEAMNGRLYVGMTESITEKDRLIQFINLYSYDPTGYTCYPCLYSGYPCSEECDFPALHSCRQGMDCTACYLGHPECKYWACENNQCTILAPGELTVYPDCDLSDPDCEKAKALFNLMPLATENGVITQGVFDKDKDFTVHQFAVVYDALMEFPEYLRKALKILIFSSYYGEAVSYPERAELHLGYGSHHNNWLSDIELFCTTIHEVGHIIETQVDVEGQYRGICYDFDMGWTRKSECEIYRDFAPQIQEDGSWSDALRARSAGGDGREDIANAISYYVCAGDLFRKEAQERTKMNEKYQFLKGLFRGREYKCEIDGCV